MDYLPNEILFQENYLEKMYGITRFIDNPFVSFIQNEETFRRINDIPTLNHVFLWLRKNYDNAVFKVIHCYISGTFWNSKKDFVLSDRILDIGNKNHVSVWALQTHFEHIFCNEQLDSHFSLFDFEIVLKMISKKPRKKRRPVSGITRQNVFMRDNYTCQICGKGIKHGVTLHLDHIVPVSKGGTNDENNLQCLCSQCNAEKHNRTDLKHDKLKLKELGGK